MWFCKDIPLQRGDQSKQHLPSWSLTRFNSPISWLAKQLAFGKESESKRFLVWLMNEYFLLKLNINSFLRVTISQHALHKHHRRPNTKSFFEVLEGYTFCLEFTAAQVNFVSGSILSSICPLLMWTVPKIITIPGYLRQYVVY